MNVDQIVALIVTLIAVVTIIGFAKMSIDLMIYSYKLIRGTL